MNGPRVFPAAPSSRGRALAAGAALLLACVPVEANAAVKPPPRPPVFSVSAPLAAARTPLEVVSEVLRFSCSEENRLVVCDFEATYEVRNPTAETQAVVGALYGLGAGDVHVEADGKGADRVLTEEEVRAVEANLASVWPGIPRERNPCWPFELDPSSFHDWEARRHGFALSVGPSQTSKLVTRGRMRSPRFWYRRRDPALEVRHPLRNPGELLRNHGFDYFVAPIRTWAKAPPIDVTIRAPASWTLHYPTRNLRSKPTPYGLGQVWEWQRAGAPLTEAREGPLRTVRLRLDGQTPDFFRLVAETSRYGIRNGGVLAGVGVGSGDRGPVRARLGYEVAAPVEWLFWSLNLDTDFGGQTVLAPVAEVASGMTPCIIGAIPSLGLGVGVPVRVRPDGRAGIRVQFTVQYPLVGLVSSFDYYPTLPSSDPERFQAALLLQVSL